MRKKRKALLRVLTAAVAMTGLLAGTGKDVFAALKVDPVVISFPENSHIEIGESIKGFLADICVDDTFSEGATLVASIPESQRTNEDKTYAGFTVAKQKIGSVGDWRQVDLSGDKDPVIEAGYEYTVQFYYRALDGFFLDSNYDVSHCMVNSEYVTLLSIAGTGSKYRLVGITLSPSNWGPKSYDLTGKTAEIGTRPAAVVLERTLERNERCSGALRVKKSGTYVTEADLDKDGNYDISINIGANTVLEGQKITKLDTCNIKEGKFTFTLPKEEMAYDGKGICCNRSVYESLTFDFGGTQAEPKDIAGATAATIEKQVYTGKAITPKVNLTLDGVTLKEGEDFTVAFQDNVNIGKGFAVATGCGKYKGTKIISFEIVKEGEQGGSDDIAAPPAIEKAPTLKSTKKKTINVSWKKVESAKGYEIAYCLKKNFKKNVVTKTSKKPSIKLKKLKSKKNYWVMVRAFTVGADGKKVYGEWSKAKKVKVK